MRVEYLRSYLLAAHDAIRKGVKLRGVFHWASTDNREWSEGFSKTFGPIRIDRDTEARTPKRSLAHYGNCGRANAVT